MALEPDGEGLGQVLHLSVGGRRLPLMRFKALRGLVPVHIPAALPSRTTYQPRMPPRVFWMLLRLLPALPI